MQTGIGRVGHHNLFLLIVASTALPFPSISSSGDSVGAALSSFHVVRSVDRVYDGVHQAYLKAIIEINHSSEASIHWIVL
ncbi:hypothetical protein BJX64DRAFT_253783, partial [Aspergillus heterothallicus]